MPANNGKRFESNFQKSVISSGYYYERLADSNKFGGHDSTRFTTNNPYDAHFFDGHRLYLCELKSTVNGSISFPTDLINKPVKENKMIKFRQIKDLMDRSDYPNVYPLLVLHFEDRVLKSGTKEGVTVYIKIKDFYNWAKDCGKGSINAEDAIAIGTVIERKKLKVNYKFNIKEMVDNFC